MLNPVVRLIQEIRDAELVVANLRDLLDTAWQQFLEEDTPSLSQLSQKSPLLSLVVKSSEEVVQVPHAAADSRANQPNRPLTSIAISP